MDPAKRAVARATRADVILVALLAGACVASAVLTSAKKYLWYDEMFGWTLAADPSLAHALRAVADGADTGPPLIHVMWWMTAHLIGPSAMALRAVSCLCFVLTLVVLWSTLRRVYPVRAVALGVATVTLGSASVTYQLSELRFYGLLSLAVAVGVACYAASDTLTLSPRLRVGTAVGHTVIVYAHTLGVLYSAALLVAMVVRDAMRGRVRPGRYVPIVVAWATFLPWLPALRRQRDLFTPHSWLAPPTVIDLADAYRFGIAFLPLILLLVVALGAVERPSERVEAAPQDRSLLIAGYALLAVPLVVFVLSRLTTPLFAPRYFIPASIGWAIVIAHLGSRAERVSGRGWRAVVMGAWALAVAMLVLRPVTAAVTMTARERPGLTADGVAPLDVPVVVEQAVDFLPYEHYAARPAGYFYVLDWTAATDRRAPLWATLDYKAMDAWRRNGLLASRIVEGDAFLRDHSRFIVIGGAWYFGWYERAIRDNPAFTSRVLSEHVPVMGGEAHAILVDRVRQ